MKKQAQKRITPTEALHILMDGGLTAHGAAARLDQAVKTNECRLWHHPADEATPDYFDEPVPPDYAAQCLTIVAHVEADGRWQRQVRGVPFRPWTWIFEFDADAVRALLSRAKLPGPQPTPERRKPGPELRHDWREAIMREVIRRLLASEKMPKAPAMLQFCEDTLGYQPDIRAMQRLLRELQS